MGIKTQILIGLILFAGGFGTAKYFSPALGLGCPSNATSQELLSTPKVACSLSRTACMIAAWDMRSIQARTAPASQPVRLQFRVTALA